MSKYRIVEHKDRWRDLTWYTVERRFLGHWFNCFPSSDFNDIKNTCIDGTFSSLEDAEDGLEFEINGGCFDDERKVVKEVDA